MRTRLAPGQTIQKAFSWSYSKLKNYRTCPKRYYLIDILKKYKEDFTGEALAWGDQVHKAFEKAVKDGTKFPKGMEQFEEAAARLRAVKGKIMVEQKLAIKKDLTPCDWFDKEAWFRGIADYLAVNGKVALAIDYKTGKILEDSEQLALLAECVFSHYPEVEAVRAEFWWLKDDAATPAVFYRNKRQETWRRVLPEVMILEKAHVETNFPATQSGLCRKHCIVTECPHNGSK
jgi:RecB family exonuclease